MSTRILFAVTVFLSAFLLFQVQPLMGRYVLPWFGGGPGVWTTCMLFFQVALLVGYAYAYVISAMLSPRRQAIVHGGVLALTLLTLPIAPDASWRPGGGDEPIGHILALLTLNVGAPFAVLAASAPLLAAWYRQTLANGSPYRLYALSNAGSLLALLGYPLVIEPSLGLSDQGSVWSGAYVAFALVCAGCAWQLARRGTSATAGASEPDESESDQSGAHEIGAHQIEAAPTWGRTLQWVLMSAVGSVVLLATTSRMCQEVSVVPMLWILPLAVYLLTFILCFERDGWYDRRVIVPLLGVSIGAVLFTMFRVGHFDFRWEVAILAAAQFACCMVCHGELVRRRPHARYLTRFYLALSVGGAAGGLTTAVVAPIVFTRYWEYHLGLLATVLILLACVLADRRKRDATGEFGQRMRSGATAFLVGGGLAGVMVPLATDPQIWFDSGLEVSRNFFGIVRISEGESEAGKYRKMVNGTTSHGVQFLGEEAERLPRSYFGPTSGLGVAMEQTRRLRHQPLRIGVIGLGVGTAAAYAKAGDRVRFYEINPEVERLARKHFTFLSDSPADVEVVIGDARVSMSREAESGALQQFDLLVLDAFNGDSVPVHLLTREAYTLYQEHLRPGGALAFHISNRYLGLSTIVRDVARNCGDEAVRILNAAEPERGIAEARWVLSTSNAEFLKAELVRVEATDWLGSETPAAPWTDDSASLWDALRIGRAMTPGKWDDAPLRGRFVADPAQILNAAGRAHVRERCRAIYAMTAGQVPVVVVTIKSVAASGGGEQTLDQFAPQAFAALRREIDAEPDRDAEATRMAVMVLLSWTDGRLRADFGDGWPTSDRERLASAFAGAGNADVVSRLRAAVDALERHLRQRERCAGCECGADATHPPGCAPPVCRGSDR